MGGGGGVQIAGGMLTVCGSKEKSPKSHGVDSSPQLDLGVLALLAAFHDASVCCWALALLKRDNASCW